MLLSAAFKLLFPLSVPGIVMKSVKTICPNHTGDPKIAFKNLKKSKKGNFLGEIFKRK